MASSDRICVIEDDEAVRDSLRALLECEGFKVAGFCSAEDFLAHGSVADASCLVVDVEMPKMDGLSLVAMLRRDGFTVPVVIISGALDPAIRVEARSVGAEFLEKPFSEQALLAA